MAGRPISRAGAAAALFANERRAIPFIAAEKARHSGPVVPLSAESERFMRQRCAGFRKRMRVSVRALERIAQGTIPATSSSSWRAVRPTDAFVDVRKVVAKPADPPDCPGESRARFDSVAEPHP